MTRRTLLLALLGAPMAVKIMTAHNGVHLRGRLDKGRLPQTARFSEALEFDIHDGAITLEVYDIALWNAITPMLGSDVQFSLFMP